jgi:hypothetical protein
MWSDRCTHCLDSHRGGRPCLASAPVQNLLVVCTNGKRNACCARLGVPLARALREGFGDACGRGGQLRTQLNGGDGQGRDVPGQEIVCYLPSLGTQRHELTEQHAVPVGPAMA